MFAGRSREKNMAIEASKALKSVVLLAVAAVLIAEDCAKKVDSISQEESHWLSAPDGPIYRVMRLYWPKTEPPSILPPSSA
jgi:hypothetical protein